MDKITLHLPQSVKSEDQAGRFKVIGVGPGLPYDPKDPFSVVNAPDFQVGDWILFQKQNAYLFQDSGRLHGRLFAMIRAGQILAKWKDATPPLETVNKILGME